MASPGSSHACAVASKVSALSRSRSIPLPRESGVAAPGDPATRYPSTGRRGRPVRLRPMVGTLDLVPVSGDARALDEPHCTVHPALSELFHSAVLADPAGPVRAVRTPFTHRTCL